MKVLTFLFFITFSLIGFQIHAQETVIDQVNYDLLDKYIRAAKDYYPRKKILEAKVESAKTAIPLSVVSYFDIFNATYFYRPDNNTVISTPGTGNINPYSVNGFQFGVNFNIGTFLQKPFANRKAKAEYKVAQLESEEYDHTLELEVKRRYYNYIQQLTQLKINTQSVQDNKNVADNLLHKFEKGEISLDIYNQSRINLVTANTAKIQSEVNFLSAKDALEDIIGKHLSEIK
ncbi:TolC family protein [Mucilaginibacter aquaedulcis]|uniref:TolC family protein n=1 Tax=Mucilaginibacter aquaedulcis TaxID=1187081 RepID=UPI0025B28BAD|nr:TolC family protein [Mucilaginibacter aquaedulcis]MDN3548274.1 TolC family protein [Mucilaginibacter aquaedulcis]